MTVDTSQEGSDNIPSDAGFVSTQKLRQFKFRLTPLNGELTHNGDVFACVTWWRPQVECHCLFF